MNHQRLRKKKQNISLSASLPKTIRVRKRKPFEEKEEVLLEAAKYLKLKTSNLVSEHYQSFTVLGPSKPNGWLITSKLSLPSRNATLSHIHELLWILKTIQSKTGELDAFARYFLPRKDTLLLIKGKMDDFSSSNNNR